jgi:PAS domain S-box-containing protein
MEAPHAHASQPRPLRLLILEDSAQDAELDVAALEAAGYTCRWERVETRDAFLARLQAPDYDLICADYTLPNFDGLSALHLVRQQGLDIPFIFISGTLGEERAIESLKAGATDYVLKTRLTRLVPVVQRALQEREERRQHAHAEQARRESEHRYRTLAEVSPVGIFHADAQGRFLYVNERWCELAGLSAEEARGDGWLRTVHLDDRERVLAEWRRAVTEQQPFRSEHRLQHPNGVTVWVFGQLVAERGSAGEVLGYVGTITNITDRKRAEEQIRQLNAELERRVKERTKQLEAANKELETFGYSVSHDLRAPLRGIEGFSQALLEDYANQLDPRATDYVQRMRAAAQRMEQLINDLLSLSRVTCSEMHWQPVDLSALARTVAAELQKTQPVRRVEFVIADDVVAPGDTGLLRVALENLLGNAWKYTRYRAEARIEFGMSVEDGQSVYFVRDNGAGFDMARAGKLFGAFQRLHGASEFEGTGIGLATVQRIIQRHGGRIWAEAAVEHGATFCFTLAAAGP